MQVFVKLILIVFIINEVNGELKVCGNKNTECRESESKLSDSGTKDLSSTAQKFIKDEKCHRPENNVTQNIVYTNNLLQPEITQPVNCSYVFKQLTSSKVTEEITEGLASLYDNLWVVIQRRQEGSVSFYRHWYHYKEGFGNPFREFFVGLDKIHYLTNSAPHELLIKLEDFKGNIKYALYDEFLIGNETEKFQLKKLGSYSGDAGDHMRSHEGMYFSTKDRDHDASADLHCAKRYQGGWWYNNCLTSNLNGPFRTRYVVSNVGVTWGKPNEMQIKIVQMMVRSKG